MLCLQCGYCCHHFLVMIVDDPSKEISDDNIIAHMGDGPCKHLRGDTPGEYSCAVHDCEWYDSTPCHEYGQIESDPNFPCRTGVYMLEMEDKKNGIQ